MALTRIKTGGLTDNSVTDAKVANAITVTGAQTGITQVGTLTAGVWNGTKVASAYLDDDTAHLSTTQTFSGAKTFTGGLTIDPSADNYVVMTSGATDANLGFLFKNSSGVQKGFILYDSDDNFLQLGSGNVQALKLDSSQNATFAGNVTISGNTFMSGTYLSINDVGYIRSASNELRLQTGSSGLNVMNNAYNTSLFTISNNGVVSTSGDFQPGADIQLQNGRGISFTNMPNAGGMTSELLDDYEEGAISTSVNGITASTNDVSGTYTKVGRVVHLEVRVTISGKSGGTGNPYITLPFNASGAGIGASIVGAQLSKNTIISGGSPAFLGLYGSTNQVYANDVSGNYIGDGDWGNGVMGFSLVYNT